MVGIALFRLSGRFSVRVYSLTPIGYGCGKVLAKLLTAAPARWNRLDLICNPQRRTVPTVFEGLLNIEARLILLPGFGKNQNIMTPR